MYRRGSILTLVVFNERQEHPLCSKTVIYQKYFYFDTKLSDRKVRLAFRGAPCFLATWSVLYGASGFSALTSSTAYEPSYQINALLPRTVVQRPLKMSRILPGDINFFTENSSRTSVQGFLDISSLTCTD